MSIDKLDWHYDSAEELYRKDNGIKEDLSEELIEEVEMLAGNHIGMFIRWLIDSDLFNEDYVDEETIEKVKSGSLSPTKLLIEKLDSKLIDSEIKENARAFVMEYYDKDYFNDYDSKCLKDFEVYSVISTEEDYQQLKKIIDFTYSHYLKTGKYMNYSRIVNKKNLMIMFICCFIGTVIFFSIAIGLGMNSEMVFLFSVFGLTLGLFMTDRFKKK